MDPNLARLVRHLRTERCPQSVIDRLHRRVGRTPAARHPRPSLLVSRVGAGALLAAVAAVATWLYHVPPQVPDRTQRHSSPDRTVLLAEVHATAALVGQVLAQAGAQTEDALLDRAMPPILKGFSAAKIKPFAP